MKRTILLAAIIALWLGWSPGTYGLDVPLKYEPAPNDAPFGNGSSHGVFSPVCPEGRWKLPSSESPLQFALLTLGDGRHLLALEPLRSGGKTDFRLHIDRDGDNDLTDETPLEGKLQKNFRDDSGMGTFSRIEVAVLCGGTRKPHRIVLNLRRAGGRVLFSCSERNVYHGMLALDGFSGTITLFDGNGNGRFDETAPPVTRQSGPGQLVIYSEGDRVLIAENGRGDYLDIQPLGDFLWIRSALYRMTLDTARDRLTLARVTRGLSPVKLPMPVERLSLSDETGKRCLTVFRPSGDTILLPPGDYRLISYQALRTDRKGERWRLCARGTPRSPVLEVKAGSSAVLPLGEPFVPKLACTVNTYFLFTNLSMSFSSVEGAGGESILSLETVAANPAASLSTPANVAGRRPGPPTYTIVKSDGELLARGAFRYG